jgi:serine O-acetyltransferase
MNYNITTIRELYGFIASDLFRYMTSTSLKSWIRGWYIAGFRYTFFMRTCKYLSNYRLLFPLFLISRIALRHYSVKYGFQIPWQTDIGPGLAIGHYGAIIVNPNSKIGSNCNLSVGVLLGLNHRLDKNGKSLGFSYPIVGDRVSIGNDAKLLGGVEISSDVLIGVGTIVTHNVAPKCVVVGNPAKVISENGSAAFVGSFHPFSHKYMSLQNI